MKAKLIYFILLLTPIFGFSQLQPVCEDCDYNTNNITYLGNDRFRAASATAYYWEVCSGNTTIIGSNKNRNVRLNIQGQYRLKLTRFVNGNCEVACFNSQASSGFCPSSNDIHYINEGGGGLCTTGQASINGMSSSSVDYVDYTWALGGYSGVVNGAGLTTPIYYPSGNWTGYNISICATVVRSDGTLCSKVCKSFLLDCGGGNGLAPEISIIPNPTEGTFVTSSNQENIKEIIISDMAGNTLQHLSSNLNNGIEITVTQKGLFIVTYKLANGETIIKKLVVQ